MKSWLTTAVAMATPLAIASSAFAEAGTPNRARRVPIAGDPSALTSAQSELLIVVVVAVTLGALILAYASRIRSRLATSQLVMDHARHTRRPAERHHASGGGLNG
jgi:hypothetical protein